MHRFAAFCWFLALQLYTISRVAGISSIPLDQERPWLTTADDSLANFSSAAPSWAAWKGHWRKTKPQINIEVVGRAQVEANCPGGLYSWILYQPTQSCSGLHNYYHYVFEIVVPFYKEIFHLHDTTTFKRQELKGQKKGLVLLSQGLSQFEKHGHSWLRLENMSHIFEFKLLHELPGDVCGKAVQPGVKPDCDVIAPIGLQDRSSSSCADTLFSINRMLVRLLNLPEPGYIALPGEEEFGLKKARAAHQFTRHSKSPLRVLFIHRDQQGQQDNPNEKRLIRNYDEVLAAIEEEVSRFNAILNVSPSKGTLHDQARLFHGNDIIILQRGAAAANLLFVQPGASVIIISSGWLPTYFIEPLWFRMNSTWASKDGCDSSSVCEVHGNLDKWTSVHVGQIKVALRNELMFQNLHTVRLGEAQTSIF